jgi:leucyl aminopeptidase
MSSALTDDASQAVSIFPVSVARLASWVAGRSVAEQRWLDAIGFSGDVGATALLPDDQGGIGLVVHVVDPAEPIWALAALPERLKRGTYILAPEWRSVFDPAAATSLSLGWILGTYRFKRYKVGKDVTAQLVWPGGSDRIEVLALAEATALARDLVNTPTEDLGPSELAAAATLLATRFGAEIEIITGDALKAQNYPLIHAVGRASAMPPCLIDLRWGDVNAPKVTLVGKGVCFDSGGLDIKPPAGMRMMKKDMGGAATVLALAHAVMATGLKLRLRVLVPAVENAISANAFRPLDIFTSRKGVTVEIGNTDAEGRLVLCDALTEAVSEQPALIVDVATLTGAARVALGPDLPALFANDDTLAQELLASAEAESDPLWRMPLWRPYRKMLDSKIADLNNAPESSFAGAITAALYLQEFVDPSIPWVHIDSFAWNPTARPGRPEGGETLGLRALYRMLKTRFN